MPGAVSAAAGLPRILSVEREGEVTRWLQLKDFLKDIALTVLGMVAIYSQLFRPEPNGLVLGAGLALTVPSIAGHVRALLPVWRGSPSPPPPEPPGPRSGRSSTEVSGGERDGPEG